MSPIEFDRGRSTLYGYYSMTGLNQRRFEFF